MKEKIKLSSWKIKIMFFHKHVLQQYKMVKIRYTMPFWRFSTFARFLVFLDGTLSLALWVTGEFSLFIFCIKIFKHCHFTITSFSFLHEIDVFLSLSLACQVKQIQCVGWIELLIMIIDFCLFFISTFVFAFYSKVVPNQFQCSLNS